MIDGLYEVTVRAFYEGEAGVVTLANGKLVGGDESYRWDGAYTLVGNRLSAKIRVTRYGPNFSVFGDLDDFELELSGEAALPRMSLEGYRDGDPAQSIIILLKQRIADPSSHQNI